MSHGNPVPTLAHLLAPNRAGQVGSHRWSWVYADGLLEERLGTDIVYFNLPQPDTTCEVDVVTTYGPAVAFQWLNHEMSQWVGLVVLKSDLDALERARRAYQSGDQIH